MTYDAEDATYDAEDATCALVEGPRWADCKFYARWLLAAAKAEPLWARALADRGFAQQVERLYLEQYPNFEIGGFVMLARLKEAWNTIVVDLDEEYGEGLEFCMMTSLGFFTLTGRRYQFVIPDRLSEEAVQQAALALAGTEDAESYLHPEKLITTMPLADAKVWQERLRVMKEEERMADRAILLDDRRTA
jgi:hypothetical protein